MTSVCLRTSVRKPRRPAWRKKPRFKKYLQAVDIYKGDFLPKSSFEEWVVPVGTYYHTLYLNAVHRLLDLLMDRRDYQKVVEVCEKAIIIDRFDEKLHEQLILAFYNVGWQQKALEHYDYITNLFYRELGSRYPTGCALSTGISSRPKKRGDRPGHHQNDLREATSVEGLSSASMKSSKMCTAYKPAPLRAMGRLSTLAF